METKRIVITDPNHWLLKLLKKMDERKQEIKTRIEKRIKNNENGK